MATTERIIVGPNFYSPVIERSLGSQIYDSLSTTKKHDEVFINAETNEAITAGGLLKLTCRLAEALRQVGIKQNDAISVCSENSIYFFCPVIAALYNGIIMAPLNTTYAEGELIHITGISKPRLIFCSKAVLPKILKLCESVNYVDRIVVLDSNSSSDKYESMNDFIDCNCDNRFNEYKFRPLLLDPFRQVAVVLCSSGTTGLPKGVMTTHQNINIRINHMNDPRISMDMLPNTSQIGLLPFFHGYGFMICLSSIYRRNKIVVLPRFEEHIFLSSVEKYRISTLSLVPPILVLLTKSPNLHKYDLDCVRDIVSGAAALSKETQIEVMKRFRNAEMRQGYGMTEMTLAVLLSPIGHKKPGSSGTVVPGMRCIVRDPHTGEHLGPNKVGELCFQGGMIMKGYMGNEKATRETFTTDGWLCTGDLGYYDADFYFYIVDRLKELIKFKGFQVPPAEIEGILLTHPEVVDCGVVGLPDELAGELPFAFVVKKENSLLTADEIKAFVADKVSHAKRLHGGVAFLKAIPKNASGKVLRKDLREFLKQNKSKL